MFYKYVASFFSYFLRSDIIEASTNSNRWRNTSFLERSNWMFATHHYEGFCLTGWSFFLIHFTFLWMMLQYSDIRSQTIEFLPKYLISLHIFVSLCFSVDLFRGFEVGVSVICYHSWTTSCWRERVSLVTQLLWLGTSQHEIYGWFPIFSNKRAGLVLDTSIQRPPQERGV